MGGNADTFTWCLPLVADGKPEAKPSLQSTGNLPYWRSEAVWKESRRHCCCRPPTQNTAAERRRAH